jgi:hypothetical protein
MRACIYKYTRFAYFGIVVQVKERERVFRSAARRTFVYTQGTEIGISSTGLLCVAFRKQMDRRVREQNNEWITYTHTHKQVDITGESRIGSARCRIITLHTGVCMRVHSHCVYETRLAPQFNFIISCLPKAKIDSRKVSNLAIGRSDILVKEHKENWKAAGGV